MKITFPNDPSGNKYAVYALNLSEPLDTIYVHMPDEYAGLMPVCINDVEVVDNFIDESYSLEVRENDFSMLLHWAIKNSDFLIELVERRSEAYEKFLCLTQMSYLEYLRNERTSKMLTPPNIEKM